MAGTAPKPVKPTEAAKRLRTAVRSLRDRILQVAGPGNVVAVDSSLKSYSHDARMYQVRMETQYTNAKQRIAPIRAAAKTRRVKDIEDAISSFESALYTYQESKKRMWHYAQPVLRAVETTPTGGGAMTGRDEIVQLIDEINALAQQFPTVDDMPLTPAENVLRAIVAVLRHAEIEGVKTNDLKWKEVLGGKKESANPTEAQPDEDSSANGVAAEVGVTNSTVGITNSTVGVTF